MTNFLIALMLLVPGPVLADTIYKESDKIAVQTLRPNAHLQYRSGDWIYTDENAPTREEIDAVPPLDLAKTRRKLDVWTEAESRILSVHPILKLILARYDIFTQTQKDAMKVDVQTIIAAAKQAREDIDALGTVVEVKAFDW